MKDLKDQLRDKEEAQVLDQAMKNDEALAPVANHIHVTVKNGDITLDGQVSNEKQMNLAANTAKAVGVVGSVHNHLKVTHKDKDEKGITNE
jgi:osmotically-inducible protein OsmY